MTEETKAVVANTNPNIIPKEMNFRFKKDDLGNKRANVKCENVPTPSAQGIIAILEAGGKQLDLLIEVAADTVRSVLSDYVGSDQAFDPEKFDYSKVSWEAIANMPKEDRRSVSIPEETWKAFVEDYIQVMPGVSGKSKEQCELATQVFVKKMLPVKGNKVALGKLKEVLAIYSQQPKAEEFSDIMELLIRRCDNYLAAEDPAVLAENL